MIRWLILKIRRWWEIQSHEHSYRFVVADNGWDYWICDVCGERIKA